MADELKDIPCDGPSIEPEKLIPKQDYEECDTCSPVDETPDGDPIPEDEQKALLDELNAFQGKVTNANGEQLEADAVADALKKCMDEMNKTMDAIRAEAEYVMEVAKARGKLDEIIDNLQPYAYYFERRAHWYALRGTEAMNANIVSQAEVMQTLQTIDMYAKMYSSALTVDTNYSPDPMYSPHSKLITKFTTKYRFFLDVSYSPYITPGTVPQDALIHHLDAVPPTEEFTGSLYVEYYNKLKDPLNNFFSAQERGLSVSYDDADSMLKAAAATRGLPIDQVATARQGEKTFAIRDQQLYSAFFKEFKQRYAQRIVEVRQNLVNPMLEQAKAKIDRIARWEAQWDIEWGTWDQPYNDAGLAFYNRIVAERDRLKKIEDDFYAKVEIDPNNPGGSQFVKDMKQNMSCLGDLEAQDEPQPATPEYTGSVAETFKHLDPCAPNPTKNCYWVKFAALATQYGLLPFPDLEPKTPGQGLRYWPVGFVIPTPATLIKIPLPIIWIPIITVSVIPFGMIVVFLGINGIMPCPYVFYQSVTGTKKFIVTLRGPAPKFGYEESDMDAGFPIKIRVPFIGVLAELSESIPGILDVINLVGIEPFDDFIGDIKKKIGDTIDKIPPPKFKKIEKIKAKVKPYIDKYQGMTPADIVEEIYDGVKEDVGEWIDKDLKLPIITLPKDPARRLDPGPIYKLVAQVQDFLAMNYALPQLADLKDKIMPKILELLDNPKLKKKIQMLPKDLDLNVQEHFEKFRQFVKDVVEEIMRIFIPNDWVATETYNIGSRAMYSGKAWMSIERGNINVPPSDRSEFWVAVDELLKSKLMIPAIAISNPFKCCEPLIIPPTDLAFLAMITAAFNMIKGLVDALESMAVQAILGFSVFSAESILMIVYSVLDSLIPSIPIPPDNFISDIKKVWKQMVKDATSIEIPKLPSSVALCPPITLDFNLIKPILKQIIFSQMDTLFAMLPIDILRLDTLGFMALDPIELKVVLKNIIFEKIDQVVEPLRMPYDAIRVASAIYRLVKKGKSPVDGALTPQEVAIDQAKQQLKAIKDNLKNAFWDTWVVPEELLAAIMMLLEQIKIPYPVTGAVAAFTPAIPDTFCGGNPLRILHPLLFEDDLPPWERLNLDNWLFVLFLDEFCHTAKQHGGLFENYLP